MVGDLDPQRDKATWRKRLRRIRPAIKQKTQEQITAGLEAFLNQKDGLFLFYRATETEISLDGLADKLGWDRFATTRTPRVGGLTIHSATEVTEQHPHGYTQPVEGSPLISIDDISVALVPGLEFDLEGNRLGQGAGYYDELLARVSRDCIRIGVVIEELIFEKLPIEPHDIPMTHLASESGVEATRDPSR